MKTTRQVLLAVAVSVLLGACSRQQDPQASAVHSLPDQTGPATVPAAITGRVVNADGQPLAEVVVERWSDAGGFPAAGPMARGKATVTGADGDFALAAAGNSGFLVAHKAGYAPAWRQLGGMFDDNGARELVLTPPGALAGRVVDEADRPVPSADVYAVQALQERSADGSRMIDYLAGAPARELFAARTDADGRFRITGFPTNATAVLAVHFPGKALKASAKGSADFKARTCRAGKTNIQLVLEPEAIVRGRVTINETNAPVPAARLTLQPAEMNYFYSGAADSVASARDGSFEFKGLTAGSYVVRAEFGTNTDWVAEGTPVDVPGGRTNDGVRVKAVRGAPLDVAVIDADTRRPLPGIAVTAYAKNIQSHAVSDGGGRARFYLVPGDYRLSAFRQPSAQGQAPATVAAGVTNQAEIELAGPRKISGLVRAPDGRPAAGASVWLVGGFGPGRSNVRADTNGCFQVEWNPRQFSGREDAMTCILVRDVDNNLAAAQEIEEGTTNIELKLAPGLTLAGRVEGQGKPITNVTAQVIFWVGNSGMWLPGFARTNVPGQLEVPAMPPGRKYGLVISAPGYGQTQIVNLEVSDQPGRQELDPVELKPANLPLAGQVTDTEGQPVAGCYVNLSGDGQPNDRVQTDEQGRFSFDHVCEGALHLYANTGNTYGNVSAEGGDTNVVLQLGQNFGSSGAAAHRLRGTVTDGEGKAVAGAQVAVFPNDGLHWFRTGANGQYQLTWSLQSWQSGEAMLVARDLSRHLAANAELSEERTNLDVQLLPAISLAGTVQSADGQPLAGARIGFWIKVGNGYHQMEETGKTAGADGRYTLADLPAGLPYMVFASANGYGRSQQSIEPQPGTNHYELATFNLKPADQVIAGQVLDANDKPLSGVNVQLNGEEQPDGQMSTDRNGAFHFRVCAGEIRLFAYSTAGSGSAQATVEAGDTNIVLTLESGSGSRSTPRAVSLKGSPLPDLAGVNLPTAMSNRPVLLCLFDANQRPSRHVLQQLQAQADLLKNIDVYGVQAAVIREDVFSEWKSNSAVSFPVGRVTGKSAATKWAAAPVLPWLILANRDHRVVAEGFSADDLPAEIARIAD